MNRISFDIATAAGVAFIGAGVAGRWGWPEAVITIGALVLAIAFLEAALFGRRS
jgi:hypothetical protein